MSSDTLYSVALEQLSINTSGDSDFEKISHILIKHIYPQYSFNNPAGGFGTQDGGYDGRDPLNNAKLACSLEINYKKKIQEEIEKSKTNGDVELFYFSNQPIPELTKNKLYSKYKSDNIDLIIFGKLDLSQEIDKYLQNNNDIDLYNLLKLSFLSVGERYRHNEVDNLDIQFDGIIYKKKLVYDIEHKNIRDAMYNPSFVSENPLFDYILENLHNCDWRDFFHIFLNGIGYVGKSFMMRLSFNCLKNELSNHNNYTKYKCIPFIQFCDLKYYVIGSIKEKIYNNIEPLLFFVDGLDEVNISLRENLFKEINNVLEYNKSVRFVISGRSSSFDVLNRIEKQSIKLRIEKYIDMDDYDLLELMNDYKGTPIYDLLPIPTYRNFIKDKKDSHFLSIDDFIKTLIEKNLNTDARKNILPRSTPSTSIAGIIKKLSEFTFSLFLKNTSVFSDIELRDVFNSDNDFSFVLDSAIIDYKDNTKISFVSNFYYEYFIANAIISKNKKEIVSCFFIRKKIKISALDIFVVFLNLISTRDKEKYSYVLNKTFSVFTEFSLVCDFESFSDNDRKTYYLKIYKKYNNSKKHIYYARFRQSFGPLKNIDNMAQKMQLLLPESKRAIILAMLKSEIENYFKKPTNDKVITFANSIILLMPFIENLWSKEQQVIIQDLSVSLLQFFILKGIPKELEGLLSQTFIFDWYRDYKWVENWKIEDWESFFEKISGKEIKINTEISNKYEYAIKLECFTHFYGHAVLRPILLPLLRYLFKNKFNEGLGMAGVVPDVLTDDYELPMIHHDYDESAISYVLPNINFTTSEILSILCYSIENNVYDRVKDSINSPIKILKEKLYEKINEIEYKDYELFSFYYFNADKYGVNERLFKVEPSNKTDELRTFFANKIIEGKVDIKEYFIDRMLHQLINLTDRARANELLRSIMKMPKPNIYNYLIHSIFNDENHILYNSGLVNSEYNRIYAKDILLRKNIDKRLAQYKTDIESAKSKEIELMLDNDVMANELRRIDEYLQKTTEIDGEKNLWHKLFSLHHKKLLDLITYDFNNQYINTPVFVECAMHILEDFYRDKITNIDEIIKRLKDYCFKPEHFYYYFYWQYIDKHNKQEEPNENIEKIINKNDVLMDRIIDSINVNVRRNFEDKKYPFFEGKHSPWITPFLYFYNLSFNNISPDWLTTEYILKLITFHNPYVTTSKDATLSWFTERFPTISNTEIINFALQVIPNIEDYHSRIQIAKYLIEQYNSFNLSIEKESIFEFIIDTTKSMFDLHENSNKWAEYSTISSFWSTCQENHIEKIFNGFSIAVILSTTKRQDNDIDYQYRKEVLNYCARISNEGQKIKITNEIKLDSSFDNISEKEKEVVNQFLASLGDEQAIKSLINLYLMDKGMIHAFRQSSFGVLTPNNDLLDEYTKLFIYSTKKSNQRRNSLLYIAQTGIKQHLTPQNYSSFEKKMKERIKYLIKNNQWAEYYEEYLLQMEQYVFSEKQSNLLDKGVT
ncbi:hypothetical protein FACS1894109_00980 [Spirochaetia bacterium]|nr:hypothetical protein FACS1894109_00980 [Spirochaetia bacterium]